MGMLRQILLLIVVSTNINIFCPSFVYAETLESLDINSSDLVIDRLKMTATFFGNVVVCLQDIKLLGDKAIFYFANEQIKDIKYIKIIDNVKAQQQNGALILADEAILELGKAQLNLKGRVVIQQGENIIHAKEMIYNGKIKKIILETK